MGKNRIVVPGKATVLKRDRAEVQNMVEVCLVVTTEGTRSGCTFVHAIQNSQSGKTVNRGSENKKHETFEE